MSDTFAEQEELIMQSSMEKSGLEAPMKHYQDEELMKR